MRGLYPKCPGDIDQKSCTSCPLSLRHCSLVEKGINKMCDLETINLNQKLKGGCTGKSLDPVSDNHITGTLRGSSFLNPPYFAGLEPFPK